MTKLLAAVIVIVVLLKPLPTEYHSANKELQVYEVLCNSGPQSYISKKKWSITDEVQLCEEVDSIKHFVIRPDKYKRKVRREYEMP